MAFCAKTVHNFTLFCFTRNEDFANAGNLTFTGCNSNARETFNLSSGIFTAPLSGTYLFTFHANTVNASDFISRQSKNRTCLKQSNIG